ncbi:succinate dehydrogenase iron-sulfur subunit [Legionella taurinensis]|uniref:Succinate dehydrogenase iron-sulfur subunit n=1 Tax=Legionella taurinensis TaxID=70611 RepID=A0A3A5L6J5_9GAMM|nr:succinate dehydrogenase iron-sulfur subunit [Legionella taurinensis]MDX1837838.1 succinate dehydrogenase iron-sulfur subunit [Legionella taurinensis]PUT39660.1 succinate dehydrogenase iron-sulfur subunit [Legionella taurinensis]PUT43353.1 succinate dehydrogenase iron-sulfur subunit [Legionella taurinensis]PUT45798.1 succinate dehydrogenase iron-sulfur subunit [Legionella taurinensis]PUT47711.1 succinate dehydrogenase iron-sulfur subunit [Legionella taurinensis]
MADNRILSLSIYRYNPELDESPYMKDYEIAVPAKSDPMLLTLLERLKAEQDPTIAYRRSCREGVCGSDGMNINGTNGLACITSLSQLNTDRIVIRPLPGFPVVRDLVVDMTQFYQQYERIEPYLQNDQVAPARERLQSPEERAQLDGLYECILCACCTSSCPSFWWNPEKFVGPAGLLQARRFLADSRDTAKRHRLDKLQDPFSVFRCRSIMNCANVCPKGLNPTQAIADIRKQMLNQET